MKLVSYSFEDTDSFGALEENGTIVPLSAALQKTTLRDALALGIDELYKAFDKSKDRVALADVVLLPPLPEREAKIICVGINYEDHLVESKPVIKDGAGGQSSYPTLFLRMSDTHVAHGMPIVRPDATSMLDYEGELAIVVGRQAYRVEPEEAMSVVAGYACYNDFSVRDWQMRTSQWMPGKNFTGVGAFGPTLVTIDEVADVGSLKLETRVNGEIRQAAAVAQMIFSIPELISYISTFTRLRPGDVIVSGTPAGVGMFQEPPQYLEPGDEVEVEVTGIGILRNPITADVS